MRLMKWWSSPHQYLLTILSRRISSVPRHRRISSVPRHHTLRLHRGIEKKDTILADADYAENRDTIAELARAEIDCGLGTQPKITSHEHDVSPHPAHHRRTAAESGMLCLLRDQDTTPAVQQHFHQMFQLPTLHL